MAGASLREITIPRFALRRDEAAAALGISPSTFDNWIGEGLMPAGCKIHGVVLWDVEAIKSHWYRLSEPQGDSVDDDFEGDTA